MKKSNVSLDEAMQIIKEVRPIYNRVTIYKKCYVFSYDSGEDGFMIGGVGSPQGVIKETGEVMPFSELVADGIALYDEIIEENKVINLK